MAKDEEPTGELETRTMQASRPVPADADKPLDQFIDRTIDRYTVRELLGEGGFGSVYLADQTEPVKRRVALKIIKLGMDTKEVIARFEQERQALAVMDHPGVAQIFDAGATDDGRPYFVMEFIDGVPMTKWCDTHQLPIRDRIALFIEVCQAIQHAHQKGVIHRDIKPSNILVCETGDGPRPVVIDFGIAKATEQSLTDATIRTMKGQFIGTPEYMSPEQAGVTQLDIDTRTDVYSLGVLLYELLTGLRPFDRAELGRITPQELQRLIGEVDPPRPSRRCTTQKGESDSRLRSRSANVRTLVRELRRDLDWIIMKCLEKDRARRYDSVSALGEDLKRYLNNEPVLASPPSAVYRMRKFVRRNRATVLSSTLLLIMLSSSSIVSVNFGISERRARTAEAEQREIASTVSDFLRDILTSPDPFLDGHDVRVLTVLDRAAELVPHRLAGRAEVEAELQRTLGSAYLSIGQPRQAQSHLDAARAVMIEIGINEPIIAERVDVWLGEALYRQRQCDEAIALLEHAHQTLTASHGRDDAVTLNALNQLGGAYRCDGELDAAEEAYVAAATGRGRAFGDDDRSTLISRHNLALVLRQRGAGERSSGREREAIAAFDHARAVLEDVVQRASRAYGGDDPQTLASASELASVLNLLNRFEQARAMYADLLPKMKRVLGEHHWRTLETTVNFGRLYQRFDMPAEAVELLERGLAGYREVRGAAFADTVLIANFLAEAYETLGDDNRAIEVRMEAYRDLEVARVDSTRLRNQARLIRDHIRRTGDHREAERWTERCCPEEL